MQKVADRPEAVAHARWLIADKGIKRDRQFAGVGTGWRDPSRPRRSPSARTPAM